MEHLSEGQCAAYRNRTLGAHDLIAVDEHLAGCEACRRRLRDMQVTGPVAPIMNQLGISHLTYEEMEAYVDQEADAAIRNRVESHSRACAECLHELNDLSLFRGQVAAWDADAAIRRHSVAPAPARKPAFRWRFSYLAAAAAAVIVLVSAGWWWRSLSFAGRQQPVLLALNDGGGQLRFTPQGRLVTGEWTDQEREVIEDSLKNKAVKMPAVISELRGKQGTQRGEGSPSGLRLVYPIGLAILTTRPTFVWQPLSGARQYTVEVFEPGFHRAAQSPPLATTEWTPVQPLEAGKAYSWQVRATGGARTVVAPSPTDPEARFVILPAEDARELETEANRHPGAHLLLGALYARAGALDRAEKELTALVEANPQSQEARALLDSVTTRLRPQK